MKRCNFLISFSVALLFFVGHVQASNWTLGGSLGYAVGDAGTSAINRQLSDLGLNATATSNSDNRNAWKAYIGYQHTSNWGGEVGYVNLGQVTTTLSGRTSDINAFLTSVRDIPPQTAQGWQAVGSYRYSIDNASNVVIKTGLLAWTNQYTLKSTTVSQKVSNNGVSGVMGLGVETEFISNVMFSANASHYRIEGEPISVLDFGVMYRFD